MDACGAASGGDAEAEPGRRLPPPRGVGQPTTAADGVADLRQLLRAAAVEGRYLLVAHSRGGMIACLYASLHPEEVAGLVLADAGSVFLEEALGRRRWGKFVRGARQLGRPKILEAADYEGSVAEIRAAPAVPAIPAVVLTSDHPFDFGAGGRRTWPAWLSAQGRLAAAPGARHVTRTNSGHHIAGERLGLVVAAVCSVIRSLNRAAATLDAWTRGV